MFRAAILALTIIVAACGGGGEDEDYPRQTPHLDCKARPELCR